MKTLRNLLCTLTILLTASLLFSTAFAVYGNAEARTEEEPVWGGFLSFPGEDGRTTYRSDAIQHARENCKEYFVGRDKVPAVLNSEGDKIYEWTRWNKTNEQSFVKSETGGTWEYQLTDGGAVTLTWYKFEEEAIAQMEEGYRKAANNGVFQVSDTEEYSIFSRQVPYALQEWNYWIYHWAQDDFWFTMESIGTKRLPPSACSVQERFSREDTMRQLQRMFDCLQETEDAKAAESVELLHEQKYSDGTLNFTIRIEPEEKSQLLKDTQTQKNWVKQEINKETVGYWQQTQEYDCADDLDDPEGDYAEYFNDIRIVHGGMVYRASVRIYGKEGKAFDAKACYALLFEENGCQKTDSIVDETWKCTFRYKAGDVTALALPEKFAQKERPELGFWVDKADAAPFEAYPAVKTEEGQAEAVRYSCDVSYGRVMVFTTPRTWGDSTLAPRAQRLMQMLLGELEAPAEAFGDLPFLPDL